MLTCCQGEYLDVKMLPKFDFANFARVDLCLTSACNGDRFPRLQGSSDPTGMSLVLNVGRLGIDLFINFSQRPQSAVARIQMLVARPGSPCCRWVGRGAEGDAAVGGGGGYMLIRWL